MPRLTRSRSGFSVIEALVALTIAAIGLTAVLELQHQLATGQARYEAALKRVSLRRSAMAIISDLNPESRPAGDVALNPSLRLTWSSTALTPIKRNAGLGGGDGVFDVQLFSVEVRLLSKAGTVLDSFNVERLGWVRIRQVEANL
jgi:general secretion pathway protein I